MPRGGSTVYDACRELHQMLLDRQAQADPGEGLNGAQVIWGHPGSHLPAELVAITRVLSPRQDDAAIGERHPRDEEYRIVVLIEVERAGWAHPEVFERAFALMREVEAAVRDEPTLRGALHADGWAVIDGAPDVEPMFTDTGHATQIQLHVLCHARI